MTQKRTYIKFLNLIVFVVTLLVGGFIFNTGTILAAENTTSATPTVISYTMSKVILSQNSDGSYNSVIVIGCAPESGDKYDMNTGKRCTYNTATTIIGCAPQSGDLYDSNTGKRCLNDTSITSPKPVVKNPVVNTSKKISEVATTPKVALKPSAPARAPISLVAKKPADKTILLAKIDQLENDVSGKLVAGNTNDNLSGREKIVNSLSASAAKAGSILHGPMSLWLILLIVIIVLGGGYGIYSLVGRKEGEGLKKGSEVKKSEPVVKSAETVKATIPEEKHLQSQYEQPKTAIPDTKPAQDLPKQEQLIK